MSIDQSTLTKGQIRKLNALRKSVGDDIAEDAFGKWMKTLTILLALTFFVMFPFPTFAVTIPL